MTTTLRSHPLSKLCDVSTKRSGVNTSRGSVQAVNTSGQGTNEHRGGQHVRLRVRQAASRRLSRQRLAEEAVAALPHQRVGEAVHGGLEGVARAALGDD